MSHQVIQLKVEDHDNFIHIIFDPKTKAAAVVDPAWDAEGIREVLKEEGLYLDAILITHADHDHINAIKALYGKKTTLFIHPLEAKRFDCPKDAVLVEHGDEIMLGSSSITVLHTAGHTAGSCSFLTDHHLITGDTLFMYGAGNVRGETGDAKALFKSLQTLKRLNPALTVWCGHDYGVVEHSTLGEQLAGNPFLLIEHEEDFVRYREHIAAQTRKTPYAPITCEALQQILNTY